MQPLSMGDLALQFQTTRLTAALKTRMQTASTELTTGTTTDIAGHLGGDLTALGGIEYSLTKLAAFRVATTQVTLRTDAMDLSLETVTSALGSASSALLLVAQGPQADSALAAGAQSRAALQDAVAALNTTAGGHALFSGAATDQSAVISPAQIMTTLKTAITGQTTAQGIATALDTWFDTPGGGYEATGYTGDPTPAGPVMIAEGQKLPVGFTALAPEIRGALKGLALGALLEDPNVLSNAPEDRSELARMAAEQALSGEGGIARLRADLGLTRQRIDQARTANQTAASTLEQARNDLIGIDPYEAATRLEQLQSQLQTLFVVTGRLSQLKLTDYL